MGDKWDGEGSMVSHCFHVDTGVVCAAVAARPRPGHLALPGRGAALGGGGALGGRGGAGRGGFHRESERGHTPLLQPKAATLQTIRQGCFLMKLRRQTRI